MTVLILATAAMVSLLAAVLLGVWSALCQSDRGFWISIILCVITLALVGAGLITLAVTT